MNNLNLLASSLDFDTAMPLFIGVLVILVVANFVISIRRIATFYNKYTKMSNDCGKTGTEIARYILDANGLQNIKVKETAPWRSIYLSSYSWYSHQLKRIKLSTFRWSTSVATLVVAAQKSALAILDKEGDRDIKRRIRLTPFVYILSFLFLPLVATGLLTIEMWTGSLALIFIGIACFIGALVIALSGLSVEKKAGQRAYEILYIEGLATNEELAMCKDILQIYYREHVYKMLELICLSVFNIFELILDLIFFETFSE